MNNLVEKELVRNKNKNARIIYTHERLSAVIENLKVIDYFKTSKYILAFFPIGNEPSFIWDLIHTFPKKEFFFPRISKKEMRFFKASQKIDFKIGFASIPEPVSEEEFAYNFLNTTIFVPALAIDIYGNRIGYGGGFYDRFLQKYKNLQTITIVPKEFFSIDILPTEPQDIAIENIIII